MRLSPPRPLPGLLLSLISLLAPTAALTTTTLTLAIPPSPPHLPNPHVLPAGSTHATLTTLHTTYRAPLTVANTFVFRNVTPGSYLADVHCALVAFAPLRVDVVAVGDGVGGGAGAGVGDSSVNVRVWETYRGNDWENKGEEVQEAGVGAGAGAGFAVKVLGPKVYYTERGSFSILNILKNPMILMGLVSMALFIGMPKMLDNMDPEMRAEFEEQQKKNPMGSLMGGGAQPGANPMGNFDVAGFLAGQSKKDEGGQEAPAGASGNGGKKGGKR